MINRKYPVVLSIAGSDSSGGAGIQADIKTCCALGVYAMTALTAVTAQNTMGVAGIEDLSPEMVYNQIKAVAEDISPDAVKIGMLANAEVVKAVAKAIKDFNLKNIVLDPVLIASSGSSLSGDSVSTADNIMEYLFPLCQLVTPNIPEAETLLKVEPEFDDAESLAIRLLAQTPAQAVLVKGGHGNSSDCIDYLAQKSNAGLPLINKFSAPRIETENTHGTGCTLSSAIACGLAKGLSLSDSVEYGKNFLTDAIQKGVDMNIGHGAGPIDFL